MDNKPPEEKWPPKDEPIPRVPIPDHELLRCIGKGSYGEVWLARNMMGIYRAVKIVHRKSFKEQRPYERELSGIKKYEPVSRTYEGFIDVLHVGMNEDQGYFYYVMELGDDEVSGQTVDPETYRPNTLQRQISKQGKLALQECLQLGLALSQALAELHKHGLVHRDIKPSNIIFVNGVPKLADIGLVADVSEARSFVGTEGFIPPEGPGAPQADIYSLGKVLYETCTGKDRQDFPELPTLLEEIPDHDGFLELNEVILNACKNDLKQRYQSALDMHADLLVVANGKSVKRLKMLERRLAQAKRMTAISMLVLAVVGGVGFQIYRERRNILEARQRQVGEHVAYGIGAVGSDDLLGSLPYFAEALRLEQGDRDQEALHRLRLGSVLAQCPKIENMWFATNQVSTTKFSPDGKRLLIVQEYGRAQIFDVNSGKPVSPAFGQTFRLRAGAFDFNGRRVITAAEDDTAMIWNAEDGSPLTGPLTHTNAVLSATFSPDGKRALTSCADGFARIWDAESGKLLFILGPHSDAVFFAAFDRHGERIATASRDKTVRLWNATDGKPIGEPLPHPNTVLFASFSADGSILLTACNDRKVRIWDITGSQPQHIPPDLEHGDLIYVADFSPDGRFILTASLDHTARLWSLADHHALQPVLRHSDRVTSADFHPDGHRIVTGCLDGTVRIWDLAGAVTPPSPVRHLFSGDERRFLTTTNGLQVWDTLSGRPTSSRPISVSVRTARLNQDGKFIITESQTDASETREDGDLAVWEVSTGNQIGKTLVVPVAQTNWSLAADASRLVAYGNRMMQIWDVSAGLPTSPLISNIGKWQPVIFAPDGKKLASWKANTVAIYDAVSGNKVFPELNHLLPVSYVDFSADSSRLITCCKDVTLAKASAQIWDSSSSRQIGKPLSHDDGICSAAFSPDNHRIVTASEDRYAIIWDASTGQQIGRALKHDNQVQWAEFSSLGKWVVTASWDGSARVWDSKTGDPLTPPLRHSARLMRAHFLGDNRHIITSSESGDHWIWELLVDERSSDELSRLAYLLSAQTIAPLEGLGASRAELLQTIWRELRAKYPATFTTSLLEVIAWHRFELEQCDAEQNWSAAGFHLQALSHLQPDNQLWIDRLRKVEQGLSASPVRRPYGLQADEQHTNRLKIAEQHLKSE